MKTYIITTREYVNGVYRVEAETREEAESRFGPGIEWGNDMRDFVEQIGYEAYLVEVEDVEEAE